MIFFYQLWRNRYVKVCRAGIAASLDVFDQDAQSTAQGGCQEYNTSDVCEIVWSCFVYEFIVGVGNLVLSRAISIFIRPSAGHANF